MKNKKLTFQEILNSNDFSTISDEIIKLTEEAKKLWWEMKRQRTEFGAKCQYALWEMTKAKISKLEAKI